MPTVHFDQLGDGEFSLSTAGDTGRRVHLVEGLTTAPGQRLIQAATAPGIAQPGVTRYPGRADLVCTDVRARRERDPTMAIVEELYALPSTSASAQGGVEISVSADLITEQTIFDINGQLMSTTYLFLTTGNSIEGVTRSQLKRAHRVEVERPTFSIVFARRELSAPLATARRYAGTVNGSSFQGEPADRWLCNVESTQESQGVHRVGYRFTLNPSGWQAVVTHSNAGVVPSDVSASNGVKRYQVYRREDFNRLGLPQA